MDDTGRVIRAESLTAAAIRPIRPQHRCGEATIVAPVVITDERRSGAV